MGIFGKLLTYIRILTIIIFDPPKIYFLQILLQYFTTVLLQCCYSAGGPTARFAQRADGSLRSLRFCYSILLRCCYGVATVLLQCCYSKIFSPRFARGAEGSLRSLRCLLRATTLQPQRRLLMASSQRSAAQLIPTV